MRTQILKHLSESCPWQDSVLYFDSIDSTNTRAKELAAQGAPHGTVLIADHQTGGRGRLGRTFLSPAGTGVYLSVILRPNCAPSELMHLTCAAAVAACDAVEQAAGFRPGIKWTNDLVFRSTKLAGILTELGITPQGLVDYVIIGIGINCCQNQSDFPEEIQNIAGSLSMYSTAPVDRSRVAAALVEALYHMANHLLDEKRNILARYRSDCITLGRNISIVKADGAVRHGLTLDIDDEGALVVRLDDDSTEIVNSGEVSIRGMYGYV